MFFLYFYEVTGPPTRYLNFRTPVESGSPPYGSNPVDNRTTESKSNIRNILEDVNRKSTCADFMARARQPGIVDFIYLFLILRT